MTDDRIKSSASISFDEKIELLSRLAEKHGIPRGRAPAISRRTLHRPAPLTSAQERLWFLEQLEPGNPAYHIVRAERLIGDLDVSAFTKSVLEIVRRHEILRTTFVSADGYPTQRIHDLEQPLETGSVTALPSARQTTVEWIDLTAYPAESRFTEAKRIAQRKSKENFNFAEGPMLRVSLIRLDLSDYLLLFVVHQIVFDWRSHALFAQELSELYTAYLANRRPELPAIEVQFADFAAWQREQLQGDALASALAYWKNQLKDAPSVLELPYDRVPPPMQRFFGAREPLELRDEVFRQLTAVGRRHGVTPFVVLLTAFKILLQRYSGQDDIVVGCPVTTRDRPETENLIGFFVNTLPLRTVFSDAPSPSQLLRRVQAEITRALAHQRLPFETLIDELRLPRVLNRDPLFQVMFNFQDTPLPRLELNGIRSTSVPIDTGTSKFDVTLTLAPTQGRLAGFLEYKTDLFDRPTIERMAGHFGTVLEGIIADPDRPITALQILTEPEIQQLQYEWNNTAADYPKDKCIHELFEEQTERTPDATALEFDDEQITYRELNRRANQLAHYLIALGIGPEELVGICVERSIEMVVGLLGILKAGGAYVPLDPSYPNERLRFMIADAQVSVLVTDKRLAEEKAWTTEASDPRSPILDPQLQVVCLDRDWPLIAQQKDDNPKQAVNSENLAYVSYTSGSTGTPKGVQIEHLSVVNCLHSIGARLGVTKRDVWLAVTTISFDISVLELFLPLIFGGRVAVASRDEAADGNELARLLKDSSATALQATPSTWQLLIEAGWQGSPGFKILCGGDSMPKELVGTLLTRGEVWNLYGPTETTIWSTVHKVECGEEAVLIGRPLANTKIYILDSHSQPVPIGVHGDLYIGGDGLARGYWNNPELTVERFIPDPFSDDANARLFRTGDRARYRSDGAIEFLGRTDNQVKIRGYRIELGEIENTLNYHSSVKNSVVLARQRDSSAEKELVGYVVPAHSSAPSVTELRRFLQAMLPQCMIPSMFVFLDALPLTPNGKVDRHALPPPHGERPPLDQGFVEPCTEIEELVAQVWREVLKRDKVGVHDNFFELGGHSLIATRVVARLHAQLRIEVPVRLVFEKPTIAGFAQAIYDALQNDQKITLPNIAPRPASDTFTPSIAQEPLLFLEHTFPGINLFNIPKACRLDGPLDLDALEWSVNRVIERHEALRTTFPIVNGQYIGQVARAAPIRLQVSDLRELNEDNWENEVRNFVRDWASEPFDLSNGPLFRVNLLQIHDEVHVLLLAMHHIIADGSSMLVFLRDLAGFYNARTKNVAPSLTPLNVQYSDYIAWQNQLATENLLAPQLAYWRDQLKEPLPELQLSSHPRSPTMLNFLIARKSVSITGELFRSLKELSRKTGNSLFVIFLTGVKALLYAYSGETDVRVATLVENRHRPETENLIGYLANTLILRTKLSIDSSFQQLARQVRDVTLAAYAHQDLPFEAIVRALEQEKKLDRACLAQIMFAYQPVAAHPVALGNAALQILGNMVEKEGPEIAITSFDLVLSLKETPSELVGSLAYNLELFDEGAVEELLQGLITIFQRVVLNPAEPISQICAHLKKPPTR